MMMCTPTAVKAWVVFLPFLAMLIYAASDHGHTLLADQIPPNALCKVGVNGDDHGHKCARNTKCTAFVEAGVRPPPNQDRGDGICFCRNDTNFLGDIMGDPVCREKIKVDKQCSYMEDNPCVDGAKCDKFRQKCTCVPGYKLNTANHTCSKLKGEGEGPCRGEDDCTEGADCKETICRCRPTHFPTSRKTCDPRKTNGTVCVNNDECVSNAVCQNGICVCNEGFFGLDSCRPLIAVGSPCDLAMREECDMNSLCVNGICRCPRGFFESPNKTCLPRLLDGQGACSNNDFCTSGGECTSASVCKCKETHFVTSVKTCAPRLPEGGPCENHFQCVKHAECSDTYSCKCLYDYYNADVRCDKRLVPGEQCIDERETQCINDASCQDGKCKCSPGTYETNQTCKRQLLVGEPCAHDIDCTGGATCNGSCQCKPSYYITPQQTCTFRKPPDGTSVCKGDFECAENAMCLFHKCVCKSGFYLDLGKCLPRQGLDTKCQTSSSSYENHCIDNAECVDGLCTCILKAFRDNSTCKLSKSYGDDCDYFNHDPQQCSNGAKCRPDKDYVYRCLCDLDHYYNQISCVTLIKVGEPCAILDKDVIGDQNQCRTNSHCDFENYKICTCDEGYYARQEYCVPRVPPGGVCNPSDESVYQCETGQCLEGKCP